MHRATTKKTFFEITKTRFEKIFFSIERGFRFFLFFCCLDEIGENWKLTDEAETLFCSPLENKTGFARHFIAATLAPNITYIYTSLVEGGVAAIVKP